MFVCVSSGSTTPLYIHCCCLGTLPSLPFSAFAFQLSISNSTHYSSLILFFWVHWFFQWRPCLDLCSKTANCSHLMLFMDQVHVLLQGGFTPVWVCLISASLPFSAFWVLVVWLLEKWVVSICVSYLQFLVFQGHFLFVESIWAHFRLFLIVAVSSHSSITNSFSFFYF